MRPVSYPERTASLRAASAAVLCLLLVASGCTASDEEASGGRVVGVIPDARAARPTDAPAAATVALSPGPHWSGVAQVALAAEGPVDVAPRPTVVFTPHSEPHGPAIFVQVVDEPPPSVEGDDDPGEPVQAGPWAGVAGVDPTSGHRWLSVGRGDRHMNVWAGAARPLEGLVAVAAALDLDRPIDAQKAAGDWRQRTTSHRALAGATARQVHMHRDDQAADLVVTTWRGVDESALLLLGTATVAIPMHVRGRPGLVMMVPSSGEAVVTWVEGPDLVAQARYVTERDVELEALVDAALEAVADLTRIDESGWERMASRATARQLPPRPEPDQLDPPRLVFSSRFRDGRAYSITERNDEVLCVTIEGSDGIVRCDTNPHLWRGRAGQNVPRQIDPGDPADVHSPTLLYGYLPERSMTGDVGVIQSVVGPWLEVGRAESVHVVDRRGQDHGWATIVDDVWVHHVPHNDLPLIITYYFRDGSRMEVVPGPGRREG